MAIENTKLRKWAGYTCNQGCPCIFTEDLPMEYLIERGTFQTEDLPAIKVFTCETELWQQACKLWHEFNEWEPYRSMMSEEEERILHERDK